VADDPINDPSLYDEVLWHSR